MTKETATFEAVKNVLSKSNSEDPLSRTNDMLTGRRIFTEVNARIIGETMTHHVTPKVPIVEIASGTGELARMMPPVYTTSRRYIQTERLPLLAGEIRRLDPHAPVFVADAYSLPFADNSVPVIVGLNAIDAIGDSNRLADEVGRVLAPNGKFIHFHDMRPNLDWTQQQPIDNAIYFPFVVDDKLVRFQRVTKRNYNRAKDSLPKEKQLLLRQYFRALEDTGLEYHRNAHPDFIDDISHIVSNTKAMQARPTSTFRELFNKAAINAFTQSGFTQTSIQDITETAITIPEELIAPLGVCGVEKGKNGEMSFITDTEIKLMPGQFIQRASLNVFVAQK